MKKSLMVFWACGFCAAAVQAQQNADPAAGLIGKTPVILPGDQMPANGENAVDFISGSGLCGNNGDQNIGWQFNVLEDVVVSGMAWHDDGGNGLDRSHEVGIWDPAGNLIAETHVTVDNSAPLLGEWRVVKIRGVTLKIGNGYIVGGYNGAGQVDCLDFNVAQTVIPQINYVDATFSDFTPNFGRPTSFSAANNGFYGVGFQTGGGACNGTEFIKKAKCKVKDGAVKKAAVLVQNATDGEEYTCDLATGQSATAVANNGKAKFKFSGGNRPPCGPNTASVCDDTADFNCAC